MGQGQTQTLLISNQLVSLLLLQHQGPLSLIKVNNLKSSPIRPCSTMRRPAATNVAVPQHHTLLHSHTLVPWCSWPAKYSMLLKWNDLKYPLKIMNQLFSPPVSGKQSILQCYRTKPTEKSNNCRREIYLMTSCCASQRDAL